MKTNTLTHAVLERRHDLHALPGYPQLVGVDVVGGAALLALVAVRLHGRAAILPVKCHTYDRGEVRLSRDKTKRDTKTGQNTISHTKNTKIYPPHPKHWMTNFPCL